MTCVPFVVEGELKIGASIHENAPSIGSVRGSNCSTNISGLVNQYQRRKARDGCTLIA